MSVTIEIRVNNKKEVLAQLDSMCEAAMEKCGLAAQAYAVDNLKKHLSAHNVAATGELMGSIDYEVQKDGETDVVTVGTDVEHGIYYELGTGKYYPGGRDTPWRYKDAKGNWWTTTGQQAKPFLKPAFADHIDDYKKIIENTLKG